MRKIISWLPRVTKTKILGYFRERKFVRVILAFLFLWLLWTCTLKLSLIVFPLPIEKLEKNYSTVCLASKGELMRLTLSPNDKYRIRLKLEDISDYLRQGFVVYEDRFFYYHPGINPISIIRAFYLNVKTGETVTGGSTITMQIARMMEPKERTIKSKIIEMLRSLQLESNYSKKEILEIYLNMVPMGGNIEGVGAAAYLYFGKPAKELSLGQSALLIGLPKSPNYNRPDTFPHNSLKQRKKVLKRINPHLSLPETIIKQAAKEPIPQQRFENPFLAPNLIIRTESLGSALTKRYTIDIPFQQHCESLLKTQAKKLKEQGSYNGALMVIDNRSMEVLVYIGSVDFTDRYHGGQINGCNIKRSPGSLLKPILYSIGIEKGLITPKKILFDIERNYDGYEPGNFYRKYKGLVTAEEALIDSLNIPAVNLEYNLEKQGLEAFINHAHLIDEKRKKIHPGLSIVLGAYPFTLEELVLLYAALANDGSFKQLRFFKPDNSKESNSGKQLLRPETCFIVSQMLSNSWRPDLPQCWEFTTTRGRIAFKTGTSFGLRDAWCIGYNPDYTVGVWFGNVNARGSSALVGIKAAAPVVVEIFNYLTRYKDSWFKKPEGVRVRKVCSASGMAAGPLCKETLEDYYIPGISSNEVCSIHKKIFVRKSDGVEVCRYCMNGSREDYREELVEEWPPDIASFFRRFGKEVEHIPRHNPSCPAIHMGIGLKIRSPIPDGTYIISKALPSSKQKIKLEAECTRVNERIYWLLDGSIVAEGSADDVFYIDPQVGSHTITVMDSMGRSDSLVITIQPEPIKSR